jgi:molybdenum cofactor cytidylyltransferase
MFFGPVPLGEAEGAIAAHGLGPVKKGTVLTAIHIAQLREAGAAQVVVARLEPGDVPENEAAARLAKAAAGAHVRVEPAFTGRANLTAMAAGLLVVDRARIDALNAADEAITLATLAPFARVEPGTMVGTAKIIPYAVPETALARAEAAAAEPLVHVAPFAPKRVALVQTMLPSLLPKVLDKTRRVTEARLATLGSSLASEARVAHEPTALADALREARRSADIVLVFGASAIADRRDVIPAAIGRAGGRVIHLGMPVDPGNLLLVAELGGAPVVGAPGCARSPKENGFDWVLARLCAGLSAGPAEVTGMGVGGLLMEIASRPQPRAGEGKPPGHRLAAVVLAAGRSTRMGGPNKLLEEIGGVSVVRRTAEAVIAAGYAPVVVVTGHMREGVEAALAGVPVRFVHNPRFGEGLSTSLAAGIAAVPPEADGALVALGDMPAAPAELLRRLAAAFDPDAGRAVVVPVRDGRRGNPVVWARRFFAALQALEGDAGAKSLIGENAEVVAEVEAEGEGAFLDVDTPEALDAARRLLGDQ